MAKDEKKITLTGEAATGELKPLEIDAERRLIAEREEAARQQAELNADRTVEEGTAALRLAEEEAQPGFQTLRDQIAIDERQALDSQALYAEMRGDRGGIGQAQAASIQNAAAQGRLAVNLDQQRLAAETAREIEKLRRQGEFRKADAVLNLTQQSLSELLELERWAKEKNLSIEQFNTELRRWKAEYVWQARRFGVETDLDLAKLAGTMPNGTAAYGVRQAERSLLAGAADTLAGLGLALPGELLDAQDWTAGGYETFIGQDTVSGNASGGAAGGGRRKTEQAGETEAKSFGKEQAKKTPQGGTGVPFQLQASWEAALRDSSDPGETMAQISASSWYSSQTAEQRKRLLRILHGA